MNSIINTKNYFATKSNKDEHTILVVPDLKAPVDQLITAVIYFSVTLSNINGDIDANGAPRQIQANMKGLASHASWNRKIRDLLELCYSDRIHIQRRGVQLQGTLDAAKEINPNDPATVLLNTFVDKQRSSIAKARGKKKEAGAPEGKETVIKLENWDSVIKANLEYYSDDRAFGRVYQDPMNEGSTGPLQVSQFISLHPIEILELAVGCTSVANWKEKEKKNSTIGRVSVVNYGLYEGTFVCNPFHAAHTGFSWEDLNKILNLVGVMWDLTQSASRTGVSHERMTLFIHDSACGSMSLKDCLKLSRPLNVCTDNKEIPRQSTEDYAFRDLDTIKSGLNSGVQVAII